MRDERFAGLRFAAALLPLVALVGAGLRQPLPKLETPTSLRSDSARSQGREVVLESVRVREVLPGGAFVGESGGATAVFRGASELAPGQVLSARAVFDAPRGEFRLVAARILPRGLSAFRDVILAVSALVMVFVAAIVARRFRWSLRTGIAPWRTC